MNLAREQYINLATFKKNGQQVLTPVWFAADAKSPKLLWVWTNVSSGKVKRVRNNGRARVAPCNAVGKLKGELQDAKARMVAERDSDWKRGWDALYAKYWALRPMLFFARFTGRYAQRGLMAVELA